MPTPPGKSPMPLRALVRHHGDVPPVTLPHPDPLDPLDTAILRELAVDARASYADVGAAVSLSAPAVKRRVDRLRARGVIRGFTVRLDRAALGAAASPGRPCCSGGLTALAACCSVGRATRSARPRPGACSGSSRP